MLSSGALQQFTFPTLPDELYLYVVVTWCIVCCWPPSVVERSMIEITMATSGSILRDLFLPSCSEGKLSFHFIFCCLTVVDGPIESPALLCICLILIDRCQWTRLKLGAVSCHVKKIFLCQHCSDCGMTAAWSHAFSVFRSSADFCATADTAGYCLVILSFLCDSVLVYSNYYHQDCTRGITCI